MKICHACGKEIPETAKVCGYCGTKQAIEPPPLPPLDPVEAVTDPAPPIEPKNEEVTVIPSPPDSEPEVVVPEPELFVPEPETVKQTERSKKGRLGWLWLVIGVAAIAYLGDLGILAQIPLWVVVIGVAVIAVMVVLGFRALVPRWVMVIGVAVFAVGVVVLGSATPPELPPEAVYEEDTGLVSEELDPESEEVIEFTVVKIARSCYEDNSVITIPAGEPLELHYGYWGVDTDYLQENLDYMKVVGKLDGNIIDGTSGYFVETPLLPCVVRENFTDVVWENAVWIYIISQIDPLSPGEYAFEVTFSSDRIIRDGFEDENGNMIEYGPGDIYTLPLTLIIEP